MFFLHYTITINLPESIGVAQCHSGEFQCVVLMYLDVYSHWRRAIIEQTVQHLVGKNGSSTKDNGQPEDSEREEQRKTLTFWDLFANMQRRSYQKPTGIFD